MKVKSYLFSVKIPFCKLQPFPYQLRICHSGSVAKYYRLLPLIHKEFQNMSKLYGILFKGHGYGYVGIDPVFRCP